jgi:hypothetical protein
MTWWKRRPYFRDPVKAALDAEARAWALDVPAVLATLDANTPLDPEAALLENVNVSPVFYRALLERLHAAEGAA